MRALPVALAATLLATTLQAQSKGGIVTGTVRDTAQLPVPGADVWLIPGGRRAKTDSAGRYTIGDLDNGNYSVTARKLGFAPEKWDARLSAQGRVEINFTLRRRTDLDTVRVVGKKGCDGLGVTGFECRRSAANSDAIFMDYPDIDARDRIFVADLFRDIPGFRVTLRRAQSGGPIPVVMMVRPYRCIAAFVDGRPANITNPIPELTKNLVAMEIYPRSDSIPLADRKSLRQAGTPLAHQRCGVILYWTQWAPVDAPPSRFSVGGQ